MENETKFAQGFRMGYYLAKVVSNFIESTYLEDSKVSQSRASAGISIIPDFIEIFSEFLKNLGKE